MSTIILGIVPAPGLPASLAKKIKERLEKSLDEAISTDIHWKIELQIDQITGAAESANEIMKQAIKIKEEHEWNYVISLTDLPLFDQNLVVLADANPRHYAAQISLPAFGAFVTPSAVKTTILHMTKELYYSKNKNEHVRFLQDGIGVTEKAHQSKRLSLPKLFRFTSVERKEFQEEDDQLTVRFLIHPKLNGNIKLILGMTMMNSPWSIMPSFKKVIGLAFATGSYMLIFNTFWKLSGLYGNFRFILLMLMAMVAMVVWILLAHNLWEKKYHYKSNRLRLIYNATTLTTLSISVLLFYIAVFILFSIAVSIFVPVDIFQEVLNHEVSFVDYLKLAWLVSSAATIAGAVGAGLENEDAVRQVTYGYRQYIRSERVRAEEDKEEREEQGKNSGNKEE